jgi:hypothetical protein
MKPGTLQQMRDNHDNIINHPSVKCGAAFEAYNYGKMIPYGAHQPQGGHRGDYFNNFVVPPAITEIRSFYKWNTRQIWVEIQLLSGPPAC